MISPTRISYWFILATFLLVGALHLGTPLLAALFSYFLLERLRWMKSKWLAILLFVLLLLAGSFALAGFTAQAVVALPAVAEKAIPSIIDYAKAHGIELPFTDWESLKAVLVETATDQAQYVGRFATGATRELVFVIIAIVVAVTLFVRPEIDLDRDRHPLRNNLYSLTAEAIASRFRLFYASFTTVMGAQLVISTINTALTTVFVLAIGLPNAVVIVGVTFLCGLLPVVGNLISNTIIVAVAFTLSPRTALLALVFLVVIHKLEYFLNGKIVGDRIRNPVWLTLLALVLGEGLMGIPGMVLAPVVLSYVKKEALKIEVKEAGVPE
ncbi:MAG TPA: AI-2E family transporter [Thermoanaerobaculia bacterium]|nr:AI-2E family transporter [Thermoanaerobaculia bacterium]